MERAGKHDGLWQFFGLTFLISLLAWGSMIFLRMPGGSTDPAAPPPSVPGLLLLALGGFAPSIAGFAMASRHEGADGPRRLWQRARQLRLGWPAYAVIVGLPMLTIAARLALYLAGGGTPGSSLVLETPAALATFVVQIMLFGPISEEFGWRGFALGRMLRRSTPLRASLLLGSLWALWHLPLFFVPGTAQWKTGRILVEFPIFAITPLASAVIYTWLHQRTHGSLWAALLFHFTLNFCTSFWVTLADDGLPGRLVTAAIMLLAAIPVARSWNRPAAAAAEPVSV